MKKLIIALLLVALIPCSAFTMPPIAPQPGGLAAPGAPGITGLPAMYPGYHNVTATDPLTLGAGESATVVICADGATYATSNNAIKVVIDHDAQTCVTTEKHGGAETELDSSVIVYGDTYKLIVLKDSDNLLWVFYNSLPVYNTDISALTTVIFNKRHYASGDGSGTLTVKQLRLGSELVTNGGMEADANWSDIGTPTANERSTVQKHSGSYSRKFTVDAQFEGIDGDAFTTVTGGLYCAEWWVYPDDITTVNVAVESGGDFTNVLNYPTTGLIQDAWNHVKRYYIEDVGGADAHPKAYSVFGQATGSWYIDDVSIKKVNP